MSWNNLSKGGMDPAGGDLPWESTKSALTLDEQLALEKALEGKNLPGVSTSTPSSSGGGTGGKTQYVRCYHSHPPYEVAPGLFIYGGSCISPVVKDADIYIGFDSGMFLPAPPFPWEPAVPQPVDVYFKIVDRDIPKPTEQEDYAKMVQWTAEQLLAGKKVHAGCIGGHGRTGMFLAALRKYMTGDADAIQHARLNYCKSAVESQKQVDYLQKVWGLNYFAPADHLKPKTTSSHSSGKTYPAWSGSSSSSGGSKHGQKQAQLPFKGTSTVTVDANRDSVGSMWKPSA